MRRIDGIDRIALRVIGAIGRRAALCALAIAALSSPIVASGQAAVTPSSVKAAFLYKFAGYVEWPDPVDRSAINIGVLGDNDFAQLLAQMTRARTIDGRPITVRRVTAADSLEGLHILFVGDVERDRLEETLSRAQALPILTVTESEGALAEGSIINFTLDEDRVRFDVALYAAEQSRLRLNSRLLAVAHHVLRTPE